jgi:hypothetical protein
MSEFIRPLIQPIIRPLISGPILTKGTGLPGWLSAFAPWASYAYGTTGLTTPQYYNMSLAEDRAGSALKLNAAGVYVGIPANTPPILGGAGHDVWGALTNLIASADITTLSKGVATVVTLMPSEVGPDGNTGAVYRVEMPAVSETFLDFWTAGVSALRTSQVWVKANGASNQFQFATTFPTTTSAIKNAGASWAVASYVQTASGRYIFNNGNDSYATDILIWLPGVFTGGAVSPPVVPNTSRNASISTVTGQPALGDFRIKLRPNILDLTDRTFWSRGVDADNEVRLSLVSGKVRLTITVGGVAVVTIETSAYSSAPGIVEIGAIAADGNQSISATGRTGATDTVAVTIPAGTIERFGGLGGTTFPNCTNMDFAVGPA